ncbi:helix-turn-helix domain-containing protein [Paremcibacter congregatus]|uniref:AraC-like ligand-binding domain-containing protein n=1 Tax=Paremcibacter congregatus TaxID=2043170 RepID=UPI0030EF9A47|tara:strand:+ start:3999 stop:4955 length:957 start_codon:yes stop_codon:yes gene_type:complete
MNVFSTKGLLPKLRREYWNDAICETFTGLVTDFQDMSEIDAELISTPLGDLTYARVQTTSSKVFHTSHHASKATEKVFLLHLQLANKSRNVQNGREVCLEAGDFTLVDSEAPYSVQFEDPITMGVMRIPYEALQARLMNPEDIAGLKFSGQTRISGLLSQMLRGFWDQKNVANSESVNRQFSHNMLDLLATSYQEQTSQVISSGSVRRLRYQQLKKFIDYNLSDPDLSPGKIARILKITPRYMHRIFAEFGSGTETVGQYMLNRRLEECVSRFEEQGAGHLKITDIAFALGFNSMTHFSRVFKEKYGASPREFRNNMN